jgi:primosomal protein N'
MYAVVAPLRRLPATMAGFDYIIPEGLELAPGDLVDVPFRSTAIQGVVLAIHQTSRLAKATLIGLRTPGWLPPADLQRLLHLADLSEENISSFCALIGADSLSATGGSLPALQASPSSISLRGEEAQELAGLEQALAGLEPGGRLQASVGDEVAIAALVRLCQKQVAPTLILVPEARQAEVLAKYLAAPVLTGLTPLSKRVALQQAWQAGNLPILIGSGKVSFLPVKKLGLVVIFQAGHEEYLVKRRAPKFDVLLAADLLAEQHQATLLTLDQLMPLRTPQAAVEYLTPPPLAPQVLEPWRTENRGPHLILSAPVLQAAENTLRSGQSVVFFLNRKGVAKRLLCGACGHLPTCGTCGQIPGVREHDLRCQHCGTEMWQPKVCPACGAAKITFKSVGLTKIAQLAKKHLTGWPAIVLEKGKTPAIPTKPHILITTDIYWSTQGQPFARPQYGLVAELAADLSLYAGGALATEITARRLRRLMNLARRHKATLYFQTSDRTLLESCLNLATVIQSERALRQKYERPTLPQS